jgi:hypothetical protein
VFGEYYTKNTGMDRRTGMSVEMISYDPTWATTKNVHFSIFIGELSARNYDKFASVSFTDRSDV